MVSLVLKDTAGLMTQRLESMAATVISPIVDSALPIRLSYCFKFGIKKAQITFKIDGKFMNDFSLITARDPKVNIITVTVPGS
jgi:hypothetical protein